MADFVAVLKKTLEGLGPAVPEMRDKVYQKARATVSAKLDAINPPPPAAVRDRQMKALEDAIATIEAGYRDRPQKPASPLDELEEVFASLSGLKARDQAAPAVSRPAVANGAASASPQAAPLPQHAVPEPEPAPLPETAGLSEEEEPAPASPLADAEDEERFVEPARQRGRRGYGGALAALVALAVVGAGGYGLWLNKDDLASLWSSSEQPQSPQAAAPPAEEEAPQEEQAAVPEAETPAAPVETDEAEGEATTEVAAATPGETDPEAPVKFNQRLNADGTETDMGAPEAAPTIGEGTSVAQATQSSEPVGPPASATPDAAPAETATPPEAGAEATPPTVPDPANVPAAEAALPVGQKAIFYEERTNTSQGSAEPGNIVWSIVQESPGGDLPPEPAIQAQATIPGKDLQLRLTIRRNGDRTLPASHIVEMIFITPEGFEGGGIDNVLRVAMKNSEQEAGNPLLGIPAKIADNYFLIALNDAKPEVEANLSLLRRQSWIDVPMVYKSGRRALFTMEKGIPGEKVFDEALKAWQAEGNG